MTTNEKPAPLRFDYDARGEVETAPYRGFIIRAERDSHAENPFTAWDGEPPTLVYSGGRHGDFAEYGDGDIESPLAALSDSGISRHWRALCKALSLSEADHDSEAREAQKDYGGDLSAHRRDIFADTLSDAKNGNSGDYLESLAAVWRIAGVVAETWSSYGYSQGDYAKGLSVATPAWEKAVGAPRDSHAAQCKYAGKLWGYWAWGNVYGYVIADADGEPLDADGDSCWGFYGDDHEESGLSEAARDAVDYIIRSRQKARQAKARDLIKARVPLALRPALLDSAAPSA